MTPTRETAPGSGYTVWLVEHPFVLGRTQVRRTTGTGGQRHTHFLLSYYSIVVLVYQSINLLIDGQTDLRIDGYTNRSIDRY